MSNVRTPGENQTLADGWALKARPSGIQQWLALTARINRSAFKSGDLAVALIVPLIFTLSFYLPLKYVMSLRGVDYSQFIMPIVILQSMGFTAMAAAQRSSTEATTGMTARIQSMPVVTLAPLASRMTSAILRSLLAMGASVGYGYIIGFRFERPLQAIEFLAFALMVGIVLALGADALGTLSKSPEALSQAITLPYLILGMLSSGFSPDTGFPSWIRPFVRNQPISHFAYVLRDLAAGGISFHVLWPALVWLGGMAIVFVPLAVWAGTRRG